MSRVSTPALLLTAVLAAALLAARTALRRRPALAFAATAVALALPVVTVGVATYPSVLASTVEGNGVTVAEAAADGATLRLLGWPALPLVPALIGFKAMSWWAFRGRLDRSAPLFS
jgi:cytochrome bd ubiquinol oxidase subunit II